LDWIEATGMDFKIEMHRIAWELNDEPGEVVTCDEDEAQEAYRIRALVIRQGTAVGRVSWAVDGFQKTYTTSPGFVWGSSRRAVA
jgi:hypothetical protein